MNQSTITGKWKEIKGDMLKAWGELTNDELDRTHGNLNSLLGILQQKFGMAKDEASQKLHDIVNRYESKGKDAAKQGSDAANAKIDKAKNNLRN